MSTPEERTRAIVQTGAFLKQLGADQALPEHVRVECRRLLRHFPTLLDVQMMASAEGADEHRSLTSGVNPEWWASYAQGPHRR